MTQLIEQYGEATFLSIEIEDQPLETAASRAGATVIRCTPDQHRQIVKFLSGFELVMSGRYHVLIFAILAGTRCVPLSSNTWKIQVLLRLIRFDDIPVQDARQVAQADAGYQINPASIDRDRLNRLARNNLHLTADGS